MGRLLGKRDGRGCLAVVLVDLCAVDLIALIADEQLLKRELDRVAHQVEKRHDHALQLIGGRDGERGGVESSSRVGIAGREMWLHPAPADGDHAFRHVGPSPHARSS